MDSLGAKAIKKHNDQALAAGDLEAGGKYILVYDGTNFQLVSQSGVAPGTSSYSDPLTTQGDVVIRGAASTDRLAIGAASTVLGSDGTDPSWGKVAVAMLANGTDGELITWDASAAPATVGAGTVGQVLTSGGAGVAPTFQSRGKLIQRVVTENVTYSNDGGANVPNDDTIPQNTEGVELMTRAITPTSATSRLLITAQLAIMNNNGFAFALFQDTTAGALSATIGISTSGLPVQSIIQHEMAAGTTSSTTFKVRFGETGGGTTYINGNASSRLLGGVMKTYLIVEEYET